MWTAGDSPVNLLCQHGEGKGKSPTVGLKPANSGLAGGGMHGTSIIINLDMPNLPN